MLDSVCMNYAHLEVDKGLGSVLCLRKQVGDDFVGSGFTMKRQSLKIQLEIFQLETEQAFAGRKRRSIKFSKSKVEAMPGS